MNIDAMVITKIRNIVIMLLEAIDGENLDRARHFLSDELYSKFEQTLFKNKKNGVKQNYEQTNVTNIIITDETDEKLVANATIRVIDYLMNRNSGAIVSGSCGGRVERNVVLTFRKNNVENRLSYKCPNCGAPLNINSTSICEYCKMSVDERFSPLVLDSIYF